MATVTRAGPGWSQQPGAPCGFLRGFRNPSTWIIFSFIASAGSWIGGGISRTQTGTPDTKTAMSAPTVIHFTLQSGDCMHSLVYLPHEVLCPFYYLKTCSLSSSLPSDLLCFDGFLYFGRFCTHVIYDLVFGFFHLAWSSLWGLPCVSLHSLF